ncbi:MAG: outer spore coat protein CotE [Erysipelotrichaceae bacterium]|nr:outer spore coat protein CotE [Erysipelotrichaceae bacterium]
MYREILTKAIIAKGQRKIKEKREVNINKQISKILGCWIINHKSKTNVIKQNIIIEGTYDAYFWYGYEFDSKCDLHYEQFSYSYEIPYTFTQDSVLLDEKMEIKEYVSKVPTCVSMDFLDDKISIDVDFQFDIDIIGETKLKIKVDDIVIDQMIDTNYVKEKKE